MAAQIQEQNQDDQIKGNYNLIINSFIQNWIAYKKTILLDFCQIHNQNNENRIGINSRMAKSMSPVTADKSAMGSFHVPGNLWIPHEGKRVPICKQHVPVLTTTITIVEIHNTKRTTYLPIYILSFSRSCFVIHNQFNILKVLLFY